jgi:hypothetical protein
MLGAADASADSEDMRAQSRTIYLNRNGIALQPGSNDSHLDHSTLIDHPISIPSWDVSEQYWNDMVMCLRELFVDFDLAITEKDPGTVPHIEVVLGGSPELLGRRGGSTGVSPFSPACRVVERAIVVAFTNAVPAAPRSMCEIVAHEIGHSYGLDHELLAPDPMTYLDYAGPRRFQNAAVPCGEETPRRCGLQGTCGVTQNSYELLVERIGPAGVGDTEPPSVTITSPANGAVLDPGFQIAADITDGARVKLASVEIDGATIDMLASGPWLFHAPADLSPGTHVLEVTATDGANEQRAMIEVTVRGAGDDDVPGCSTGGDASWLVALLLLSVAARSGRSRDRARRTRADPGVLALCDPIARASHNPA